MSIQQADEYMHHKPYLVVSNSVPAWFGSMQAGIDQQVADTHPAHCTAYPPGLPGRR